MQWSSTFPAYTAATWDSNIANFNGTGGSTAWHDGMVATMLRAPFSMQIGNRKCPAHRPFWATAFAVDARARRTEQLF
jgi:hypothetical protein